MALDFGTKSFWIEIDVSKISNLIFIDLECDFNEKSFTDD